MILTYKYRLKGGDRIQRSLRYHAKSVNFVWNFCVETQKKVQRAYYYGLNVRWPTYYDLSYLTKGTSNDLQIHAQTVQATCKQFIQSRDQRRKCPRFRISSGPKKSLRWIPFQKQSRQLEGNAIYYLGKLYRFFGEKRRPLPPDVRGGAFVEDASGRWWVTFQVGIEDERSTGTDEVGIDLGLKTLATLSTGDKIENSHSFCRLEQKLATAQRSGNKRRIRTIYEKITNTRKDHLHKASAKLARNYKLIIVGNVNASKLAKTRMAKSVYDASWSAFRTMLRYKASRHGATYVEVDERFTSQRCSCCGVIPVSSPKGMGALGIREWVCSFCGASHDRDVNAAKNILNLGRSATPPVEGSRKA